MLGLAEIAEAVAGRVVVAPAAGRAVDRVYAGDRISDLLDRSSASTLIVTNLASRQLVELAALMDVPAVCLLSGGEPDAELARAAEANGTALLVSPHDMFETCGRLWARLSRERGAG